MSTKIFNHIYPSKKETQQTSPPPESAQWDYYAIALCHASASHTETTHILKQASDTDVKGTS
jgi:hypothetical protein